jgi:hypothetical protein
VDLPSEAGGGEGVSPPAALAGVSKGVASRANENIVSVINLITNGLMQFLLLLMSANPTSNACHENVEHG